MATRRILLLASLPGLLASRGLAGDPTKGIQTFNPSGIRGADYTPSYASTSIATWKNFDGKVIDRQLGHARLLGFS